MSFPGSSHRRLLRVVVAALAGCVAIGALAACTSSSASGGGNSGGSRYGFPEAAQSSSATITVWVDSDRVAAANAFKKANPDVPINVVTYDGSANGSNSFKTKIGLIDRAGQRLARRRLLHPEQ